MNLSLQSVPAPKPEKPVCRECGSDNVISDATAYWDDAGQCWQVSNTYDKGGYCENCHQADIRFDWIPVDEYEAPDDDGQDRESYSDIQDRDCYS